MRICSGKKAKAGASIVVLTLAATMSYEVRALMAALMIFSIAFAALATAYFILALIQEAVLWGISQLKGNLLRIVRVRGGRSPILPRA